MTNQMTLWFRQTNKQYRLEAVPSREVIAGRDPACDLPLETYFGRPIPTVSSRHFKLYHRPDRGFFIMDVHSRNGTRLNGEPLTPDEGLYLRHGDEIMLANDPQLCLRVRLLAIPPTAKAGVPPSESAPLESLTDREMEVLRLLPTRLTQQEMAHHLSVSHNTIKSHIKRIYEKLGVNRRGEAIVKAKMLALID